MVLRPWLTALLSRVITENSNGEEYSSPLVVRPFYISIFMTKSCSEKFYLFKPYDGLLFCVL